MSSAARTPASAEAWVRSKMKKQNSSYKNHLRQDQDRQYLAAYPAPISRFSPNLLYSLLSWCMPVIASDLTFDGRFGCTIRHYFLDNPVILANTTYSFKTLLLKD